MVTKEQIRHILDDNLPKTYVHFQRKDLIAELVLDLIKKDQNAVGKIVPKKIED